MGGLSAFTIGDLGVFIGTIGSVITGILIALQSSRCKKIKCCGCECDRSPPDKKEEVSKLDAQKPANSGALQVNRPTTRSMTAQEIADEQADLTDG